MCRSQLDLRSRPRNAADVDFGLLGLCLLCVFAFNPRTGSADTSKSLYENQIDPIQQTGKEDSAGFRNGSFVVAPIPFSNPLIESGLALGAGYLFQLDPEAKTSTISVGALKSSNGSEAFGFNVDIWTKGDTWKLGFLAANADLNYSFVDGTTEIPVSQTGQVVKLDARYNIHRAWFVGAMARYLESDVTATDPIFAALSSNFSQITDLSTVSYGLILENDTRDDDIYPRRGAHFEFTGLNNETSSVLFGSYPKATALFDVYRPVKNENVLAFRMAGCATSSDAPFYDLCSIGGTDSFRGFNPTVFLDNNLVSFQAEYRHTLTPRFGVVVFAGAGAVGSSFGSLTSTGAAGGMGLRFRISKKVPVNFSIDASYNSYGKSIVYVSVGESF